MSDIASAPVVVGIDGTPASDLAVRWASETAALRHRELLLVHGLDLASLEGPLSRYGRLSPEYDSAVREIGAELLADARALAERTAAPPLIRTALVDGDPADTLIAESATAHLVVLGGPVDRLGVGRLGSILMAVVSRSEGAVVVVRGRNAEYPLTGPVVVGVDGSPISTAATELAFREAALRDAPLVAVHSWADPYAGRFTRLLEALDDPGETAATEQALLAERLAGEQERHPSVVVERSVARGSARDQLLSWSDVSRMLVVGSRGRGRFARFMLGSTSATLVQRANCPVMVVHPPS